MLDDKELEEDDEAEEVPPEEGEGQGDTQMTQEEDGEQVEGEGEEEGGKREKLDRLLRWLYLFSMHAIGPALSVTLHVLVLMTVLVVGVEVTTEILDHSEVQVLMQEVDSKPVETPPEPKEEEEVTETEETEPEFDYAATSETMVDSSSAYSATQGTAEVKVEEVGIQVDMPNIASLKPGDAAVLMPGIYANRGGKGRNSAIGKFGGAGTMNPVLKALRWLKDKQNSNGTWGSKPGDVSLAMTGLAVMCFLAHGETPQSAEFGNCVQKALEWYVGFYFLEPKADGYAHAIATYAVAEAYGMTQMPLLKKSVDAGIGKMLTGVNSLGGYTYKYGVDGRTDLSVSAWNYQAMKAAYAAGCDNPELMAGMEKAVACLRTTLFVPDKNPQYGMFAYAVTGDEKGKPGSSAMLGAGLLCLQLLGEGGCPEAKAAIASLKEDVKPGKIWISYGQDAGGSGLYAWYYLTQAMFQATSGAGPLWEKWNRQMKLALIGAQQADGHWEKPPHESHGGDGLDGQLYATTLACLCLEVYYRFLPSFKSSSGLLDKTDTPAKATKSAKGDKKHADGKPKDGKDEKGDDDVGLKILDAAP